MNTTRMSAMILVLGGYLVAGTYSIYCCAHVRCVKLVMCQRAFRRMDGARKRVQPVGGDAAAGGRVCAALEPLVRVSMDPPGG